MSGWIKWEKDLETDPRFLRITREITKRISNAPALQGLGACNAPAFANSIAMGALLKLWSYADTHIRADDTLDMSMAEIDELVGVEGFAALLPSDWLHETEDGRVELPEYQAHNSVEAKKKAQTAKRVAKHRASKRNAGVTHVTPSSVTGALPDQTRPDQTKTREGSLRSPSGAREDGNPVSRETDTHRASTPDARPMLSEDFEQFLDATYPATAHSRNVVDGWHRAQGLVGGGLITEGLLRTRLIGFRAFVDSGGYSGPHAVPSLRNWLDRHHAEQYWARDWAAVPTKAEQRLQENLDSAQEWLREQEEQDRATG